MFYIDAMSRTPVYEQITEQLERFLLTGVLKPGDQLPSVRSLSVELSINPNTILKAYNELDADRLIFSVPGKGYFIREDACDRIYQKQVKKLKSLKELVGEMALAGIDKQTIFDCIDEAYNSANEEEKHND